MSEPCNSEDLFIKCLFVDKINGQPIPGPCPVKITSGASAANVVKVPVVSGRAYWYKVSLYGVAIGATMGGRLGESWTYELKFSASTPMGAAPVIIPPTYYRASTLPVDTTTTTWMVVGGNFEMDVRGQAGYTIRWQCKVEEYTDMPP